MTDKKSPNEKTTESSQSLIAPWLDFRRKRFWAWVAVLAYTLVGFFLVPVLVSHFTIKNIQESMDREASIAEVRVNPYVLSLEVNGFELKDTDGERLFSFDQFFVNFQASSLFRWALTFREIRLDGMFAFYERFTPEDDRLARLLADMERLNPETKTEETSGDLPRLLVSELAFNEGRLLFRDHAPGETVEIPAGPISVSVQNLNTLPDINGNQQVQVKLNRGATLTWQGDLSLQPLRSQGEFTLDGSELDPLDPYFKAILPLDSIQARLSAHTNYLLSEEADDSLSLTLSDMEARLENVAITGLEPASEFLAFDSLEISGGVLKYPEQSISFDKVLLNRPFVDVWLDENGQPGLLQLVPPDEPGAAAGEPATPWDIRLDEFSIAGGRMALADRGVQPNAEVDIQDLELTLSGIDNQDQTQMPLSLALGLSAGGTFGFEGEVIALPDVSMEGTATTSDIPVSLVQPYVQQYLAVAIESGLLRSSTEVSLDPTGAVRAVGTLGTSSLKVGDTRENESLLAWSDMAIDRFEVDTSTTTARISSIRFTEPYGRIQIKEDLSTNLGNVMLESPDSVEPTAEGDGWTAVIGGIAFDNGSMDFSDLSLFLPFATRIGDLDGTISTIDNKSAEPSNIRMEGQVDDYGLSRIEGSMNLLDPIAHTDVSVEFRNLLMTSLSPYSAEFAGQEIDEGKLDLDLQYVINDGQLDGKNAVVLSDIVLGDKVDNPDAISLPLGLAIGLLKNSEGVIDIELPVEGDINDPEFKIGGVVWKAFTTLITKIVSAPFKLLGSLIGIESEDFGQFEFLAGRSDLTPPELEKIVQIQQALAQRPELAVEVSGVYDPAIDTPALQYFSLRDTIFEQLGRDPTEEGDRSQMLDDEILGMFEALFIERFPGTPLASIQAIHSAPPADDPEGKPVLDRTAYAGELQNRLVASEPVGEAELSALADQRAQAVADAFLASGELDPARVVKAEPTQVESEDEEWVVMELGVAVD